MAQPRRFEFLVRGMTCAGCARNVTDAIQAVPGVESASVDLGSGVAVATWSPGSEPDPERVIRAVEGAGYQAKPAEQTACGTCSPQDRAHREWAFNVAFGLAIVLPLAAGEWIFGLGGRHAFHWASFALSGAVMAVCGRRFFLGAWRELRRGRSNMDTLVVLGSSTAFSYSAVALFAGLPGHLYFLEAAAIVTLISAGHWLESLATARASRSLRSLMDLAPPTARLLSEDGSSTTVPVESLRLGDRVILKPGDRVPTDAQVLEGLSAVDESMLTGESLPVEKAPGSRLYAGTVNQSGMLVARVEATGEETALAQIVSVVQRAQSARARIQRLGDRVSSVFVPIVVAIAIGSGLWWGLAFESALYVHETLAAALWKMALPGTALAAAFVHAASVLIVACPCAMGLATPAAIMVGTAVAARRGILIRDGVALEKSGTITSVAFDKTGTITRGRLAVVATLELDAAGERSGRFERLAAVLASRSDHPLSRAVANLEARGGAEAELDDWEEVRGRGIVARRDGEEARLGSLEWLESCGVPVRAAEGFVAEWSRKGATVLGLSVGESLRCLFALRDELKPEAAGVVAELARRELRVYLVSGDSALTAQAIGAMVGIPRENVFARVGPEEKTRILAEIQARGERVAFVGDGINDAPALEQADLGIAVSRASDVAREAADVVLLSSEIQAVPEALEVASATLRTIRQNLFWAFFYNAAAVPLAALGFLNPIVCAAAMGLSDIVVIGNALRLERYAWRVGRSRAARPDSCRHARPREELSSALRELAP